MFPENIVQATFQQVQTNYVPQRPHVQRIANGTTFNETEPIMKPILEYTNEVNVLGKSQASNRITVVFEASLFSVLVSVSS